MKLSHCIWLIVEWLVWYSVMKLATDQGDWISLIVASGITSMSSLTRRLAWIKRLFDISDRQLVEVSAHAVEMQREIDELRRRLDLLDRPNYK